MQILTICDGGHFEFFYAFTKKYKICKKNSQYQSFGTQPRGTIQKIPI